MKMKFNNNYFFLIPAVAGIWLNGFWGGIITGSCLAIFLAIFSGKKALEKTTKLIDKRIMDAIINLENEKLYGE